ncbi:MAG: cobyrinate a,c-diamide synthase, partial [Muribaculaceae bacterium]|nr:cobyrinate a,c-diamide synthase [Muribaculaceae bacterium]
VRFSPLRDERMPEAGFLYLPGGYPELYAMRLAANVTMRKSIKDYINRGGYALAECGGMLYLGKEIDGAEMCGVLPLRATMEGARLHLGYRSVKAKNFSIRGHEFHYSSVIEEDGIKEYIYPAQQYDVRGTRVSTPLYRCGNAIAGYTHLYFGQKDISGLYEDIHTQG